MSDTERCPVCTSIVETHYNDGEYEFFECPVCGRYQLKYPATSRKTDRNHMAAYLVHHAYKDSGHGHISDYKYHTVRDKEFCDQYGKISEDRMSGHGYPVHMDEEMIEAWYPKTFSERIDDILLYLAGQTEHIGQKISLSVNQMLNVLFVDKQKIDDEFGSSTIGRWIVRDESDWLQEANYMLRYLREQGYIETEEFTEAKQHYITLMPKGFARVDELQKYSSNSRNVLVAMSFNDTQKLREAIRKGITQAGYIAIFIDEVQHNDFITPELLKHIRDSKFVVVDLTHKNNGAYFEEGYAMGVGKPVIQLCQKGVQLHFDIAQKNTIMWKCEEDIPDMLYNRIKATIE